jgi:hypothetical protein
LGEPPKAKPNLDTVPTLASVETTVTREVDLPKEAVVPDRAAPKATVVPLERPTPTEMASEPAPAPASPGTPTGSYWVDPSLVSVAAEKVSVPESQQGVALRFGEPERESGNQVRIPVALRLESTSELISFQMVIRVEQEPDEST